MNHRKSDNYRKTTELCSKYSERKSCLFDTEIPFFLSTQYLNAVAAKIDLDADTVRNLNKLATRICADSCFLESVRHIHHITFIAKDCKHFNVAELPEFEWLRNDETYIFNLLIALSGFKTGFALNQKIGIPEEITLATFRDIRLWCRYFKQESGIVGIDRRILGWLHNLLNGGLYRLGRLQFAPSRFRENIHVFRQRQTGVVMALAGDGIKFNTHGQYDEVNGIFDPASWISSFYINSVDITGYPIVPSGFAQKKQITLKLSEWEEVLKRDDEILEIHIPGDGNMLLEDCVMSFKMAANFFSTFLPQKKIRAYSCHSWLLDPQFENLLAENANILQFQRSLYLYPIKEGEQESLRRIFGFNGLKDGLRHAPRRNRMQNNVISFLEQGGHLRGGGGFFLAEDQPFQYQKYRELCSK